MVGFNQQWLSTDIRLGEKQKVKLGNWVHGLSFWLSHGFLVDWNVSLCVVFGEGRTK